jgi:predicted flap endonuclease-1-like 5' DNA nuclease
MAQAEMKNAPRLEGWAIGVGVGVVAFGAAYVPAGVGAIGSVAIGVVLCLVVGMILGMPAPAAPAPAAPPAPAPKPAPRAEAVIAPAAVVTAPVAAPASAPVAAKPSGLAGARGGKPDDLKQIKGVGPKLEEMLHRMGYYHFDQIAGWTPAEIAWVDENLEGFRGRVTRDHWVDQAKVLAVGGETAFSKRVEDGGVY